LFEYTDFSFGAFTDKNDGIYEIGSDSQKKVIAVLESMFKKMRGFLGPYI
jgi:hypothetical protein